MKSIWTLACAFLTFVLIQPQATEQPLPRTNNAASGVPGKRIDGSKEQGGNPKAHARSSANKQFARLKPIGDWSVDPQETAELQSIFTTAAQADASISPGPDAPAQRRGVDNELRSELYSFLNAHTNSAYGPSVRIYLAHGALIRSCYTEAMDLYGRAWGSLKTVPDATAQQMAREASGGLARLLALTGKLDDLDSLAGDARQLKCSPKIRPVAKMEKHWNDNDETE